MTIAEDLFNLLYVEKSSVNFIVAARLAYRNTLDILEIASAVAQLATANLATIDSNMLVKLLALKRYRDVIEIRDQQQVNDQMLLHCLKSLRQDLQAIHLSLDLPHHTAPTLVDLFQGGVANWLDELAISEHGNDLTMLVRVMLRWSHAMDALQQENEQLRTERGQLSTAEPSPQPYVLNEPLLPIAEGVQPWFTI